MRVAVVVVAVALWWGGPVHADPFTPPTLVAVGGSQRGAPVYATANRATGPRICTSRHADFTGHFPEAVAHDGSPVSWRIPDARRPRAVSVTLWRVGAGDTALGPAESVPVTLAAVRSGRKVVAWSARSSELGYGDLRLDVVVTWPKGRCGADEGRYRFHLRSLPGAPGR